MIASCADFSYWEFAPRAWTVEKRRQWSPDWLRRDMIEALVGNVLQPTRDRWGRLDVTSGIRTLADHRRLLAAGYFPSKRSDHYFGLGHWIADDEGGTEMWPFSVGAVDIVPAEAGTREVWNWMRAELSPEVFGQLLDEKQQRPDWTVATWIHVSNNKRLVWSDRIAAQVESKLRIGLGTDGSYMEVTA